MGNIIKVDFGYRTPKARRRRLTVSNQYRAMEAAVFLAADDGYALYEATRKEVLRSLREEGRLSNKLDKLEKKLGHLPYCDLTPGDREELHRLRRAIDSHWRKNGRLDPMLIHLGNLVRMKAKGPLKQSGT
jgi:hypothetical protein